MEEPYNQHVPSAWLSFVVNLLCCKYLKIFIETNLNPNKLSDLIKPSLNIIGFQASSFMKRSFLLMAQIKTLNTYDKSTITIYNVPLKFQEFLIFKLC